VTKSGEWDRKGETDEKVQGTEELGSEDRSQQDGQTSPNRSKGVGRGTYSVHGLPNNAINISQKQKPQSQQANSNSKHLQDLKKSGSCPQIGQELLAAPLGHGGVSSPRPFSFLRQLLLKQRFFLSMGDTVFSRKTKHSLSVE